MTFTVTYRGANGAPVTEAVEAADRADCLEQLKARGIAATSVKEGAKPGRDKRDRKDQRDSAKNRQKRKSIVPYVVLVALVALAAGGIWWWMRRDGDIAPYQDDEPARKKTALAKEVTPTKAAEPKPEPVAADVVEVASGNAGISGAGGEAVVPPAPAVTNPSNAGNKKFRIVRHPNTRKKSLFKEKSDQRISRLLSVEPGGFLVGSFTYKGFKDQFLRSLNTPIEITDEDSPKDAAIKRAVLETRADLKARLDAGEDIEQIMEETERELRRLSNYRMELVRQINIDRREGKFSSADMKDYVEAANQLLKEKGIKPLAHPEMFYRNVKVSEAPDASGQENRQD